VPTDRLQLGIERSLQPGRSIASQATYSAALLESDAGPFPNDFNNLKVATDETAQDFATPADLRKHQQSLRKDGCRRY
jgi:hypothetical protein